MIAIDTVQRAVLVIKRYWLYLCIPVALLIASVYIGSTYSKYRITVKIGLKGVASDQAVEALCSKKIVQKALDQLPFQASYYDERSPRDEVFGSTLRERLVFYHYKYPGDVVWMKLKDAGAGFCTLVSDDTTAYYHYNKVQDTYYGKFSIIRRSKTDTAETTYLVRLNDPAKMLDEYYSNLNIKTDNDEGSLSISVVSGSAQKGVRLLNKMLQLYSRGSVNSSRLANINSAALPGAKLTILEKPEDNIRSASMEPVWIYIIALFGGLVIPVSREVLMRRKKKYTFKLRTFTLPKFAERVQHHVAINKAVVEE
jgi:hypothetical protein